MPVNISVTASSVGGNIGNPLLDYADKGESAAVVVAEVSSFQLDTIDTFRPRVGVLLNISPDHLDRYPDFNAYARSKGRLFENQQQSDTAVLNGSDPIVGSVTRDLKARKLTFYHQENAQAEIREGAIISWGNSGTFPIITIHKKEKTKKSFDLSVANLRGRHNIENAAAASLAAMAVGGSLEGVQSARKAGLIVLAVTNSLAAEKLTGARQIFASTPEAVAWIKAALD